jgi:hypothetical protein
MVKRLYIVWLKIDKTLPWVELKGTYETRREAKEAAEGLLRSLQVKVVSMPERRQPMKAVVTVRR